MMRAAVFLATLLPSLAFGQVVERGEDLTYNQVLDSPIGNQIVRTLERLSSARDAAKEVEEIQGADNTATWCGKLFTGTPSCTSAGDAEYDITSFAEQAQKQLIKLYECADSLTCGQNARLPKFRRASNELSGALSREADPQIVTQWQSAISTLAEESRRLNDEFAKRLDGVNAQTTQIIGASTAQQLCNDQWFYYTEARDCDTAGDEREKSEDLKAAMEAMQELFDCANDVDCGTGDRLTPLQKYVRIR